MITNESRFNDLIATALEQPFAGWDFSYIRDRWQSSPSPWDYEAIIKSHLPQARSLLDMGTGGGEFLASLSPLPADTHATEAWQPNIPIAKARLNPLGITVHGIKEEAPLPFTDNTFDLIINRHEWYDPCEVYRILKPEQHFITQQVGGKNDLRFNEVISGNIPDFIDWQLSSAQHDLIEAGFEIIRAEEAYPPLKFFDIGAIVYYLKVVEWQIPDFDVTRYRQQLANIHNIIEAEGEFMVQQHRFLLIARKP
ncbi:MAG: class I SAM-dependent methyltransferase [Phototrophicaceae bacterium]